MIARMKAFRHWQMALMGVILWVAFGLRFHQLEIGSGAVISALASVLTVAVTYALGKRLFDASVGLLAACFVALNTFSIYHAQQPDLPAGLTLIAVCAMGLFVLWVERPNRVRMAGLVVLNMAGLYLHSAFLLVIVAQGVGFVAGLLNQRVSLQRVLPYLLLNGLTAVLVLPLIVRADWQPLPASTSALQTQEALATILGYFAFGITTGTGVTIAVIFFLLFALIQLDHDPKPFQAWRVTLPFGWVVGSIGVCLALGILNEANFKLLLPAQIGFALWLARGAWVLWHTQVHSTKPYAPYIPKLAAVLGVVYIGWTLIVSLPLLYHASLIIK